MSRFPGDASKWFRVDLLEYVAEGMPLIRHARHWCYTLPQALDLANGYINLMPTYRLLGWKGYEVRVVDMLFGYEELAEGKIFEEKGNENEDHQD